jgi:predicted TPR repeat methyltransferase
MLGLARFAALGIAFALAGCVTTAENSLSQNDIASMKLTGVTVSFAPDAQVQWEDGIRAYAAAKAITDDQIATATNTPEGRAYVQGMLAPRIRAEIEKVMVGQLNGARPVRLDVIVKTFALSSAVQRVLIGGGRGMVADANLVDARTGAVIIANPDLRAVLFAGQGIVGTVVQAAIDNASTQNVVEKLVDRYGESYRDWLLRRT